jgi:hypothetical protein
MILLYHCILFYIYTSINNKRILFGIILGHLFKMNKENEKFYSKKQDYMVLIVQK